MSTKEIFELIKKYLSIVWDKKLWVILCTLFFAVASGLRSYYQSDTYSAELTFMINEDEGNGSGGIAAILGQFGFGGSSSKHNFEKILEISRSNKILDQVVLDSAIIDGVSDLIGNHIIEIYEYHERWKKDTLLNNFKFTQNLKPSLKLNSALKKITDALRGSKSEPGLKSLLSISYDDESTVISILGKTKNPELSIALSKSWYDKILRFYILKSTERQQKTLDQLVEKGDSIYGLLLQSEYEVAKESDRMGLIKAKDNLPSAQRFRELNVYSAMYAEVLKNRETADFLLKNQMPFFQRIDIPILPIDKDKKIGWIIWIIIGGIMGLFLSSMLIILFSIFDWR